MSPYFNTETGEVRAPELYTDAPDVSGLPPDAERAAARTLESTTPHVIVSDPLAARDAIEKMLADKTHPAWDPSHPAHEVGQKRYLELVMLERGANPLPPRWPAATVRLIHRYADESAWPAVRIL